MVEHRPRDPESLQLYEDAARRAERALWLRGPCLVCGEWVAEEDPGVVWLAVAAGSQHRADLVCHAACLGRIAHPSVSLPPLDP
jgi:hypothetical protein